MTGSAVPGWDAATAGVDVAERRECDVNGCTRLAVEALRFRDQAGHVHVCGPCSAIDREHCDVTASAALPCPWMHNGAIWTDVPRELT